MFKHKNAPDVNSDATFLGWQRKFSEDIFPLFNITVADHPLYRSTVSETTLQRLHLRVPRTPSPYPDTALAPWDHLGIELNYPKTAKDAIEMAGLNYTVVKRPLLSKKGLNQVTCQTVRTDTGEVLGAVQDSYEPIQNIDAFKFFDALVAEDEATYDTAGVLGNGQCIWILAKLPGYMKIRGNDIVNKYILLINRHDGGTQVRAKITPIRVVCNNTLTAALKGAGDIAIRYSPDTVWDSQQTAKMLTLSNFLYEELDLVFNNMARRKITDEQLRAYVQALVPDNEESQNTARTEKIRQSVLQLHDSGHGSNLARGTVWGAFNSVAEYTDHMMSEEDSDTRLNSIWFGRGEQLKSKAFNLAERLMRA